MLRYYFWHSSEACSILVCFVLVYGTQGEHSNHLFIDSWVCFSSFLANWNSFICIFNFCSLYFLLFTLRSILFSLYTLFFTIWKLTGQLFGFLLSIGPNNCSFSSCGLNCNDEIVAAATEPYGEDVCLYLW